MKGEGADFGTRLAGIEIRLGDDIAEHTDNVDNVLLDFGLRLLRILIEYHGLGQWN